MDAIRTGDIVRFREGLTALLVVDVRGIEADVVVYPPRDRQRPVTVDTQALERIELPTVDGVH